MEHRLTEGPRGSVEVRDVAEHVTAVEPGPTPLRRAVVGLAVGAGVGFLAALLTPRPARARRRSDIRTP